MILVASLGQRWFRICFAVQGRVETRHFHEVVAGAAESSFDGFRLPGAETAGGVAVSSADDSSFLKTNGVLDLSSKAFEMSLNTEA